MLKTVSIYTFKSTLSQVLNVNLAVSQDPVLPVLSDLLSKTPPPKSLLANEKYRCGWGEPIYPNESNTVRRLSNNILLISLNSLTKKISKKAIKEAAMKRKAALEADGGKKLTNLEFNDIKTEIEDSVLSKTLSESNQTLMAIIGDKYLLVEGTGNKAERAISDLRLAIGGSLPITPIAIPLNDIAEHAYFSREAKILYPTYAYCKLQLDDGSNSIPEQTIRNSESIPEGKRNFLEVSFGYGSLNLKITNRNNLKAVKLNVSFEKDLDLGERNLQEATQLLLELENLLPILSG
jgi:hypothetical protein